MKIIKFKQIRGLVGNCIMKEELTHYEIDNLLEIKDLIGKIINVHEREQAELLQQKINEERLEREDQLKREDS